MAAQIQNADLDFGGASRVLNLPDAVSPQEPATLIQVCKRATAEREYWVSPSGNDANPGTTGSRFATLRRAITAARDGGDMGLYGVTIWLEDGTYTVGNEWIDAPRRSANSTGAAPLWIRSVSGNRANCTIAGGASEYTLHLNGGIRFQDVTVYGCTLFGEPGAGQIQVSNCLLDYTDTSIYTGCYIALDNCVFSASQASAVRLAYGGVISLDACSIAGSPTYTQFIDVQSGAYVAIFNAVAGGFTGLKYSNRNGYIETFGGGTPDTFIVGGSAGVSRGGDFLHAGAANAVRRINGQQADQFGDIDITANLISSDADQTLELGTDGKLLSTNGDFMYTKRVDFDPSGSPIYIGRASIGSLASAATWQIKKIVFGADDDVTETFADGNANFDNVWDNRLSLTYT